MTRDPHQVLGLAPGASAAEVKRVYRRLAKEHHPDSAGEGALPRFLEIQRAYEQLTSANWPPGARRPASTEPWRADPARARSTPGAKPPGERAQGAGPQGAAAGAAPEGAQSRPGTAGSARPKPGTSTRREGATGRRRPAKKATFGSTTYDEAHDPADPAWSGASWYGPTSGEYWQVNPREYADPRKHGPEYLARAAARAATATERGSTQADKDAPEPPWPGEPEPASRDRPRPSPVTGTGTAPEATPRGAQRASRASASQRPPPASPQPADAARERAQPAFEAADAAARSPEAADARGSGVATASGIAASEIGTAHAGFTGAVLTRSPGLRRILGAVVAWPPLGIAAAALIGEATGCAAFEASCTRPAHLYPWFAQAVIVLGLLAAPRVSRLLAGGTAAVAILAFPVAAALSAGGATYDRVRGPAALIAVLAVAWAAGVGAMFLRRSGRTPAP